MNATELLDRMGLPRLLGIRITIAEPDHVQGELVVQAEHCTVGEMVHGGTLMAFADTLGAVGTVLNLRAGQTTTTIESKTNFLAGTEMGSRLVGDAVPLHRGRRTQVWETQIRRGDGRVVAKVTQTQLVIA